MQIIAMQERDTHAGQRLGRPGQIRIGCKEPSVQERDIGARC